MFARHKSTSKRKAGGVARATLKKAARKSPVAAPGVGVLEALARKIVRATGDLSKVVVGELYTQDCESQEPTGDVSHGLEGIQKKHENFAQMQKGGRWKAVNVFVGKRVICIEWNADITLNDGRTVKLLEVAVHEIRGGKIVRERFYYNPMELMLGESPPRPGP